MGKEVTRKSVKAHYEHIIRVGYCELQHLLKGEASHAYIARVEGWAADVYEFPELDAAIVTGYAPFGNIQPARDVNARYDKFAAWILDKYCTDWETARRALRIVLEAYIKGAIQGKM